MCRHCAVLWGAFLALLSLDIFTVVVRGHYTNQWAVQVKDPAHAKEVASSNHCVLEDAIFDDVYLMSCHHVKRRSVEAHAETHQNILLHSAVEWAEQQKVLSRKKRQVWRIPSESAASPANYVDRLHLNDIRWPQMWYLNRGSRLDMNVQDAWLDGFNGQGISVTILDDGIERSHPDIISNYDAQASFDVNQDDNDPTPRYDMIDSNRHGTRCAGEVAATANNSECAVGIAFKAGIGGVRMLDGDVTDAVEARSLSLNNQHIHIYSASWGPDDDGKTVDGPGRLATRAFLQGITEGRGAKGSIFVWASGNGGRDYDNCNCDGYTNSVWTLSVSSATENGLIPWYSEACSSTLATTYSSGSAGERRVVTTDLHHTCTLSHTGTSASAPLAAGIIALVLQANTQLTWRDVQHITLRCAHKANLRATDWAVNALGRNYSHSFGYGMMDASCMVKFAQKWKTVPEQKKCLRSAEKVDMVIPGKNKKTATIEVTDCDQVKYLEHVQAHVTLAASKRGDVQISLISPSGTRSILIDKRPKDYSRAGFSDWPFLTVHMWEESPLGTWTLEVYNDGRSIVELKQWSLSVLGTEEHPQLDELTALNADMIKPSIALAPQPISQSSDLNILNPEQKEMDVVKNNASASFCLEQNSQNWCSACESPWLVLNGRCVDSCPEQGYFVGKINHNEACVPCYYSCKTCTGPNDYECLTCFGDAELEEESASEKYCHNKSLINRVFSSSRWYYVLSIGLLVNFCVIVVLVLYIIRWRRRHRNLLGAVENGAGGAAGTAAGNGVRKASFLLARTTSVATARYKPVQLTDTLTKKPAAVPFHDLDTSSDEEEIFRKPYTDVEVK